MSREQLLMDYYAAMSAHFGPSNWWPGESPFEVAVGAVLTQNTNWRNVEKAVERLRAAHALSPAGMFALSRAELEEAARPSGFFSVKAQRLLNLLEFFRSCPGWDDPEQGPALGFLADWETQPLREALLSVRGIGRETADSILLYALNRPIFVADAYTKRLLNRHGLVDEDAEYEELREFFMDVLPEDGTLYNEYHALIVRTGKDFCRKSKPLCGQCPLGRFLEYMPEQPA